MSPSISDNLLADRYRLLEPIGIGGMAEVRRGWDTVLRRHVAVKLFQPGFDAAAERRFDNEVRTLAGLSHPGLVSVYDADTRAGTPFVVLQLVEGRTLRELIDQGPLDLDRTRRLGAALSDALAHVHAHDLVHRDVKPSNILLDAEDNAYLADFGLVHLNGATRLTRTDQMVGTAAYLAPEQVLGEQIDHPADVYALGLVLLECLTGRREYQGSEVEAAVARLHRPPAIPDDLPPDLADLLSRMTASAPHDRPTAHDCTQVLGPIPLPLSAAVPPAVGVIEPSTDLAEPTAAAIEPTAAAVEPAAAAVEPAAVEPAAGAVEPAPDLVAPIPAAAQPAPDLVTPTPDTAQPAPGVVVPTPDTAGPTTGETTQTLAPPRDLRPSWKTLVSSAGVLVGAFAITMTLTSGQQPATSAPPETTTQQASPDQPGSSDAPQDPAEPQYVGTPQTTGEPSVTTTSQPGTPASAPAAPTGGDTGDTADPVTAPYTETTTEPAVTTTEQQPTTTTVAPTTESSATSPEESVLPPVENSR